jgi:cytochrome c peroxidase
MKRPDRNLRQAQLWLVVLSLSVGLLTGTTAAATDTHSLQVEILPRFADRELVFDSLTNRTEAGQCVSVTRLDFLIWGLALRRVDGTWHELTNGFAYISGRVGRTRFQLSAIAAARYDEVRFHVGVPPAINHTDPSAFPAGHPLNPEVNGLHWGWMGGYVFLAIEGHWCGAPGTESGYSYHLATDRQLMKVSLPVALELSSDCELQLTLDIGRIFAAPHLIILSEATSSTHSRTNDPFAAQLRENIEQAFSVASVRPTCLANESPKAIKRVEMAPLATPYRFTMSAFLPQPALPTDNPLTEEGVELGRRLFFEALLSLNNSQSCASCHNPVFAFSERKKVSIGAEGQSGHRNAMPLFNLAWKSSFFWDGRAASLRDQVLQPIQNPLEMHESLSNVVRKLSERRIGNAPTRNSGSEGRRSEPDTTSAATEAPDYRALFSRAFGASEITADRLARALEQFLLTQTSHESKFDRVLKGEGQFTAAEQRGFELFHTEYDPRREQFGADCFHCHGGPLFQSQSFANNGLDTDPVDPGRSAVTGKKGDKAKFAVPSLRNVELTAPYMHDGRFETLEEVIEHYATGVKRSATLDPNLAKHPAGGLPLSSADKRALVDFLKTLTDMRFRAEKVELASRR